MVFVFFCFVGFKNGINGNVKIVIDVICVVKVLYYFYLLDKNGCMMVYCISGNLFGYIILCGGDSGLNFDVVLINEVC